MKKINIFLIILVLVLGSFLLYHFFSKSNSSQSSIIPKSTKPATTQSNTTGKNDISRVVDVNSQKITISEADLTIQVQNKRFLESSYLSLEYSKINNQKLEATLKAYIDNNSKMKKEDITSLIDIDNGTFTNRYLKVFVETPDKNLADLNSSVRRILYQMKTAYDTLSLYGKKPIPAPKKQAAQQGQPVTVAPNAENSNNKQVPPQKKEGTATKSNEPVYDMSDLKKGLATLQQTDILIDKVLQNVGNEDVKIETSWVLAKIDTKTISSIMDKSNGKIQDIKNTDNIKK